MMSPAERAVDPYIVGHREPAPAVVSFNGTVASLAVTMLLAIVTDFPSVGRHLLYDALRSSLRVVEATPQPNCFICSRDGGVVAQGDDAGLMLRQDG